MDIRIELYGLLDAQSRPWCYLQSTEEVTKDVVHVRALPGCEAANRQLAANKKLQL